MDPCLDKYRGKVIVLEGIIGAGKTELSRQLLKYLESKGLRVKLFTEYVNELLLRQYISNMTKYAYTFQLFMLNKRIETYNLAKAFVADNASCAILDRSLLGDATFARMQYNKGNFTAEEWECYRSIAKIEARLKITIVIYLDVVSTVAMERIKKRNRTSENEYTIEYLDSLSEEYERTMNEPDETLSEDILKLVRLDWNGDRDFSVDNAITPITNCIEN
jgi:deoxyadenosine/deoxycytidine kinase